MSEFVQPNAESDTAPAPRAEIPKRSARIEVDEKGDVVFRFKLDGAESPNVESLSEFYRCSIQELLTLVRLYSKGRPVRVDSFAFLNEPDQIIPILKKSTKAPTSVER